MGNYAVKYKIGFLEFNKYQSLYGTGRLIFKNRFFAYLDSKIFPSYNNRNIRYIDRQKEIFSSGIGYRNDWFFYSLEKEERIGEREVIFV